MSVLRYEAFRNGGGQNIRYFAKTSQTVFLPNSLVGLDTTTGKLKPLPSDQTTVPFVGVIKVGVDANSANYATTDEVAVDTFQSEQDTFVCEDSAASAVVGTLVGVGSAADKVAKGATTKSFRVVKVLPNNQVVIKKA